jgi:tetratricopeptide (TPR) repeat protein
VSCTPFAKLVLALAYLGVLFGQRTALDEAAAAFEQGRAAEAGQKLDTFLKDHPADLRALLLKGAVLDSLERYSEAESHYQRALKVAPRSAQVLNNVANHYLASGNRTRAREFYLKAIAQEPGYVNANLQLAQMSVEDKQGPQALVYLNRLDASANSDPAVRLLRARGFAASGQCDESGALLEKLEGELTAGTSVHFSAGMTFADCKRYDRAELSFSRALDAEPGNFDILYNLGLAALEAGHAARASSVLDIALHQRPDDPDCLYAMARACIQQERPVDAAALLARAQKLAPRRADVLLLLAQVSARLQFYKDAVQAYDSYLKLKPMDDIARRERGFALACAGQFQNALPDLESYVRKHPRDAVGLYELSIAQTFEDRTQAIRSLDRALALDPRLISAHYSRALLNMEDEKPELAADDLLYFIDHKPDDFRALAQLGKAYLAMDRPGEAAEILQRAMNLAPDEPLVLIQYRRALVKLGRAQEAALILSRLQRSGASAEGPRPQSGLIDYLSLPPAGQRELYVANLRRKAANTGDLQWKMRLGAELLAEGKTEEGLKVFREIGAASPDPSMLAACGRILLGFEQYDLARQFLEGAAAADSSSNAARLDLASARFHVQGAPAALQELDRTPEAGRKGDYYLLRAQILDSLGKVGEAAESLNRGIRSAPTRPDLYLQAAAFLLKHRLYPKALALLQQASRILPDNRDLLLAQAVTLVVIPLDDDAQKLLARMQARWPEWDRPYLLSGILLEIQLKSAEARQMLETAIALGANTPEAYYYEALAITHTAPNDLESAHTAITRALQLTSKDPYIYLLAGKISLARKEYAAAIEQLACSTSLLPTLIPAHYALHDAYKAVGDEQRSAAELETIQRIAEQNAASDRIPFPTEDFIFGVKPPG